jgi:hypothetical protein
MNFDLKQFYIFKNISLSEYDKRLFDINKKHTTPIYD